MDALKSTRTWGRARWHSDLRARVHRLLDLDFGTRAETPFAEIVSLVSISPQNASAVAEAIGDSLSSTSDRIVSNALDLVEDILNSPNPSTAFCSATTRFMSKIFSLADSTGPVAEKASRLLEKWRTNHPRIATFALHRKPSAEDTENASSTAATDVAVSAEGEGTSASSSSTSFPSINHLPAENVASSVKLPFPSSQGGGAVYGLYATSSDGVTCTEPPDLRQETVESRARFDNYPSRRASEGTPSSQKAQQGYSLFLDQVRSGLSKFESLHVLQLKPLDDPEIKLVRIQLENALPTLNALLSNDDIIVTENQRQDAHLFIKYIETMLKTCLDQVSGEQSSNEDVVESCESNTSRPADEEGDDIAVSANELSDQGLNSENSASTLPETNSFEEEAQEGAQAPASLNITPCQRALLLSIHRLFSRHSKFEVMHDVRWWEAPYCDVPMDIVMSRETPPSPASSYVASHPSFAPVIMTPGYFYTGTGSPTIRTARLSPGRLRSLAMLGSPTATHLTHYAPNTVYAPQQVMPHTFYLHPMENHLQNRGH